MEGWDGGGGPAEPQWSGPVVKSDKLVENRLRERRNQRTNRQGLYRNGYNKGKVNARVLPRGGIFRGVNWRNFL